MLQFQVPGSPGGNLLEHLLLESIGARRGGGIFAWANAAGAKTLLDDPVMVELLRTSDFRLVVGTDLVTDTRAVAELTRITTERPRLQAHAFLSPPASLFHPKLAWFEHDDHLSLIVGSGNLTMGGLLSNWEAFVVERVSGTQAREALDSLDQFLSDHATLLLPLRDPRVLERVSANDGDERRLRRTVRVPAVLPSPVAVAQRDEVLVAEIPKGARWKQANFDRENYEMFFGAKVGSQRRIVLQSVRPDGTLGPIESRPSVEVASHNYRFELSAASGLAYPTAAPPIGVFARIATGQFLYSLLLPGTAGFADADAFLTRAWDGRPDRMRRVRANASTLESAWPSSPLWSVRLPDL